MVAQRKLQFLMQTGLEARIARIEARAGLEELVSDLARAFDAGPDAALVRELFTQDATFEIDQYGTLAGRDAIADGVTANSETGFSWTLHYLVSPRFAVAEDNLRAELDFMLWEAATAASGRAYWIGGRYDARAIVAEGRWRFTRLVLDAQLISHNPAGWSPKPSDLGAA